MSLNHRSGCRYLFVVLAVFMALMLSATGGAAAPGKDKHRDKAQNGHRSSDLSLLGNLAPPPPPSAPAQTVAKWKGKLDERKAKLTNALDASETTLRAMAVAPPKTGGGVSPTATAKTLVLYDSTGAYAFLGEQYAIGAANLSSHFGSWTAEPAASYTKGQINGFTAAIYFGSTYDEPLPAAFLDDVLTTAKPVLWGDFNIWQLANRANQTTPGSFVARYGWDAAQSYFDPSSMSSATPINQVTYKSKALTRDGVNNLSGILNPNIVNTTQVTVLASAVRSDSTTLPWAIRSANLTYLGEIPFSYMKEEDRILAFDDLLFDLYGQTQVRHRAMVRLEDINPTNDPAELMAIADYLSGQGVPFGFGVFPIYKDPLGYFTGTNCTAGVQCGPSQTLRLRDAQVKAVVDALKYLVAHGGTIIEHGYTHQWEGGINPYNKVSGDDFEFYRTIENPDHTLNFAGPVPGDSTAWATGRITSSNSEFTLAGLAVPKIFEFPHYAASAVDYKAVAAQFNTRWERTLYFNGLLTGSAVSYTHVFGQMFPFAVKDVYGTVVLPENLGNIEPVMFYQFPTRSAAQLINAADLNTVVRDGVACFYFHPFWFTDDNGQRTTYLQDTVAGIKALGYSFVAAGTAT